jgi:hypothetical protein
MDEDRTIEQVRAELEDLVDRTVSERFRIIKDGKPVAALVYIGDLEVLEQLDEIEDAMDMAEIERIRAEEGPETWIPIEKVAEHLGLEL